MPTSGSSDGETVSPEVWHETLVDAEFFHSLVKTASDPVIVLTETGTICYANGAVEDVFGYEPAGLIGEPLPTVMPDKFQGEDLASIDAALDTDGHLNWNNVRFPGQHRDGQEIMLLTTLEQQSVDGEQVFTALMREVSEQVQRERRLERQNDRLERFASIVSHDLRDPLNTARASLNLARAGQDEALDDLVEIHQEMETLIENVLTLAREGETVGETELVSIKTLADRAWRTAGTDEATLTVATEIPRIDADPGRLQTLFQNLFRNAVEHGGEDVTVTIGPLPDNEGLYLEDTGPGFTDVDTEQIFEYGYTTNQNGTGFGLNIVKEITEAHGWTITAGSGTDGGARFEIRWDSDE